LRNLSLINKLLYLINIVLVLLWFCAFLSPYINPQNFTFGAILAIGYPILLLTHLFFVIYWLVRFNKVIFLSVAVLLLSYFFSVPVFQTKSKFKALAKDSYFSTLTFNSQLFYFSGGQKETVREHQSKVAHFLKQENVDILCLQEARESIASSLNYPFQSIRGFNHIYSKYKIVNSGEILFSEKSTNQSCYADILVHYDTIRVYNLHLESLHLGNDDYALLKEWDRENQEDEFKDKTQKISNKINKATSIRVNQVETIMRSINDSPYPTLLCGDFNDVPQSYIYRKLNTLHKDAFLESGKGFGATYRQLIFPFRIDYILADKQWSTYNFEVLDEKLSDHQAIRCDIEIK
jgi:endonuclease/exonuclease/phosphatase family metal-dependent hydrolase